VLTYKGKKSAGVLKNLIFRDDIFVKLPHNLRDKECLSYITNILFTLVIEQVYFYFHSSKITFYCDRKIWNVFEEQNVSQLINCLSNILIPCCIFIFYSNN